MFENIGKFWATACATGPVECYDENEIIFSNSVYYIRKFQDGPGDPVLFRPPTSGHDEKVLLSMSPGKSPVETIKNCMPDSPVYALCYHPAGTHENVYFEDLVDHVAEVIKLIDRPVHLIGMCQGGYSLLCHTAIDESDILSLHLMASATDFHKGGGYFYDLVKMFGIGPVEKIVADNDGIMPGKVLLTNFVMMNPYERFIGDYLKIVNNVVHGRSQALEETAIFRKWFYRPQDTEGGWVVDVNRDGFRDNKMINGKLEIHGRLVDPSKITIPVGVTWGKTDDITVKESARAIMYKVASEYVVEHALNAGHMGVYIGKKSQVKLKRMMLRLKAASARHIAKRMLRLDRRHL
jgi:poly(3-hydroxyalkanoate) synthetase